MKHILAFLTLGEWFEANIVSIVVAVITWLITAGGMLWGLATLAASIRETSKKVDALTLSIQTHGDDLYDHAQDGNVHTTFEYRQSVNARFDRVEAQIHSGNTELSTKIDRLLERTYGK